MDYCRHVALSLLTVAYTFTSQCNLGLGLRLGEGYGQSQGKDAVGISGIDIRMDL